MVTTTFVSTLHAPLQKRILFYIALSNWNDKVCKTFADECTLINDYGYCQGDFEEIYLLD